MFCNKAGMVQIQSSAISICSSWQCTECISHCMAFH